MDPLVWCGVKKESPDQELTQHEIEGGLGVEQKNKGRLVVGKRMLDGGGEEERREFMRHIVFLELCLGLAFLPIFLGELAKIHINAFNINEQELIVR